MSIIIFPVLDDVELYVIPAVPAAPVLSLFAVCRSAAPAMPPRPALKFIPMDCDLLSEMFPAEKLV